VVGNDVVRIVIEAVGGGTMEDKLPYSAIEQDPAHRGDVIGEEDLDLAEAEGEGELAEGSYHGHAAPAFVLRVHVLIAGRIVQLLGLRANDGVLVAELPVVDLRPRDLGHPALDRGGDVLNEEVGL